MSRILIVFSLGILFAVSIFGQTASDFENKYGSQKYYEIRPYTLVSPKFDKNGQICSAEIRPTSDTLIKTDPGVVDIFQTEIIYHSNDTKHLFPIFVLDSKHLREIFDELAPPETRRGKPTSSIDFSGFGASYAVKLKFENVSIFARIVLFEKAKIDSRESSANLDSFFNPPFGKISSAVIVWTERTCIED